MDYFKSYFTLRSNKPEEPKMGDICIDATTRNVSIWCGVNAGWDVIAPVDACYPPKREETIVAVTCNHCGAPSIKGHKCEYCGGYN